MMISSVKMDSRHIAVALLFLLACLVGGKAWAEPSTTSASTTSDTTINVTWWDFWGTYMTDPYYGYYRIERSTDGSSWTTLTTLNVDSTYGAIYGDTGLSPNTTYYYRVYGHYEGGLECCDAEGYGSTVNATTYGPPAAPSSLSATAASTSQINLSWADNSSNESSFSLERKTGSGGTYAQIATPAANATSYNDAGLSAATTYYYRIRAYGSYGYSSYSADTNATTASSAPAAPSGLTATTASTTQINLIWTDNSSDETGFKVERKTGSGGTYSQITTTTANATSYSDTGLTAGATYYYRVRSTNGGGDSSYSSEANATTGMALYYIYPDQIGTPRVIKDTSGNTVWDWENDDPFGNNAPNQNPSSLGNFVFNLRFPGQYADSETGLFYNGFRDYNAFTGRYVESDPIGLDGGLNTYSYVDAGPLLYGDSTGLFIDSVDAACIQNPELCKEIFGQIIENAGALSAKVTGDRCIQEEAIHFAGNFREIWEDAEKVAAIFAIKKIGIAIGVVGHKKGIPNPDWTTYPKGVPFPVGPIGWRTGADYDRAYRQGKTGAAAYRRKNGLVGNPNIRVHHILPIKFGGDPLDFNNMVAIDKELHDDVSAWWRILQNQMDK